MKYVFSIALMLVGFCFSTLYGFKQGVQNYAALESVIQGSLSSAQVKRLNVGGEENIEKVKDYLQVWVNNGLDQYSWYEEKGNHLLSKIFLNDQLNLLNQAVLRISEFRATYPERNIAQFLQSEESKKQYFEMYERRKSIVVKFSVEQVKK